MRLPDRLSADPLKETLLQMQQNAGQEQELQALIAWLAATTVSLLPTLPTFSLKDPIALARRPLHYAAIALVMLLAAAMFSAQVTDVVTSPGKEDGPEMFPRLEEPDNTYARRRSTITYMTVGETKLMVLVSAPVTLLLCLALLLLTRHASALHTLLAALLALAMAAFHCFLSTVSLSWMLLLAPSSITTLSLNLRMGIALAEPLLAAVLTALALSYLGSLAQRKEGTEEPPTRCRRAASGLATVAALATIVLAMTALALNSDNLMTSLSGHWNTTESARYQSDCPEGAARNYRQYYWDDDGNRRLQTTTTPASWPDHCFGVSLDSRLKRAFTYFSLSQHGLSYSLLVLGLLVILAGTKLRSTILLVLGIAIFGSTVATTIFYFISLIDYVDANILIICEVIAGMVVGLGLTFAGCGSFIDLLSALLKTVVATISLTGLLLLSMVGGIIALARLAVIAPTVKEKVPI
jgi:MFS family permease